MYAGRCSATFSLDNGQGGKGRCSATFSLDNGQGGKGRCSATFSLDNGQGGKALFTHNACPPNFIVQFSSVHLFHFQHINIVKRIYQAGNQYKHINYNTKIITVSHMILRILIKQKEHDIL